MCATPSVSTRPVPMEIQEISLDRIQKATPGAPFTKPTSASLRKNIRLHGVLQAGSLYVLCPEVRKACMGPFPGCAEGFTPHFLFGDSGAVDQGRQAGGEDDAAELPSISVERSAAPAECDRLQPGQPLATVSAAQENRQLVADESAATTGEDGRTAGEACSVLLADAGGRASDARTVRCDVATDRDAAASRELTTGFKVRKPNR